MKKLVMFVGLLAVVLSGGLMLATAQDGATVMIGGNDELGEFLVDANGMTLYIFLNDEPGVTNCYDQCAENWPPLTVGEGELPTLGDGLTGWAGMIPREDGTVQVAYNGAPLYYWKDDMAAGDATGQGRGDVWYVATAPTVGLGGNEELGSFLVDSSGMTLYLFLNDEEGVSNCYEQCAENWPPLMVGEGAALTGEPGLSGELTLIERTDGTMQVAYNGAPLYYWKDDMAAGDATGQARGDVWYVLKPPSVEVMETEEHGPVLVGPNGMTLYLFTNDEPGVSNCYEQCAVNWPPLLVAAGETPMGGEGVGGMLGVTERTDGTFQVTYNDAPLYYWVRDVIPGDTTGQGVRDVWFVLEP